MSGKVGEYPVNDRSAVSNLCQTPLEFVAVTRGPSYRMQLHIPNIASVVDIGKSDGFAARSPSSRVCLLAELVSHRDILLP